MVHINLFSMADTKQGGKRPSSGVIEAIAGLSAGTLANLVGHPLEIVKTRLQSKYSMIQEVHELTTS